MICAVGGWLLFISVLERSESAFPITFYRWRKWVSHFRDLYSKNICGNSEGLDSHRQISADRAHMTATPLAGQDGDSLTDLRERNSETAKPNLNSRGSRSVRNQQESIKRIPEVRSWARVLSRIKLSFRYFRRILPSELYHSSASFLILSLDRAFRCFIRYFIGDKRWFRNSKSVSQMKLKLFPPWPTIINDHVRSASIHWPWAFRMKASRGGHQQRF